LCRWLLLSLDRLPGNQLDMTQELIGNMLGVRREAVTEAAGKLQAAGLIQYSRGHITIIDRSGLEARSCECYAVVKREYDRLFQLSPATRLKGRSRPNPETLRQRAEARFRQSAPAPPKTQWDYVQLVHELQVHQIELEMHNEELRHSYDEADALRDRYADIYDFAPVGYFSLDRQGVILDMNLAGSILLGIKGSQKGRHRFAAHVAPDHLPAFNNYCTEVLQARHKMQCELALLPTQHRPVAWVRIEGVPDENGEECRLVVLDITVARQAEASLREREQYQRALLDNFPFMVWLKDRQSRFLAVNTPFAKVFGKTSPNELIGQSEFDITRHEYAEMSQAQDLAVLETGERKFEEELLDLDGRERWYEIGKAPVELAGKLIGTVGFARDVTEQHDARRALKHSERRYRSFIEKMPLSIAILQGGLLKFINPKGLELIGHAAEDCLDKSFMELICEPDRPWAMEAHREHSLGQLAAGKSEIRLVTKAGKVIDCLLHVNTVEWEGHIAVLVVLKDITAKKAQEAELLRRACIDPLTELATRAHFLTHTEQALSALRRGDDREVVVLLVALDDFPMFGEALGPLASDAFLHLFAALLRGELRQIDFAGRIDGEQFAVLLPGDPAAALIFAERLQKKVAGMSINIGGRQAPVTLSIGIAPLFVACDSGEELLALAGEAAAAARQAGGDRSLLAGSALAR